MTNKWFKTLSIDLLALLLGVILTTAFAPFGLYPFAILAPMGLLALIIGRSAKRAFWLGWIFGIGLFSSGVYWIFISINSYGDVPAIGAGAITAAFIIAMGLFPAVTCYLTTRFFPENNTAKLVYAFPAIWVVSEWLRSWIGSGFPWLFIGYSQTSSPLKGFAPILSVYGVSLAALITGSLLLNAYLMFRKHRAKSAILNILIAVCIWVTGGLLSLIPWSQPLGQPITVSMIQGNIPQSLKWSPEHLQLSLERYRQLSEPLWKSSNIVIWPEAAIPLPFQDAKNYLHYLDTQAEQNNSTLIAGIPIEKGNSDTYFNAIITLGKHHQAYAKRRLVPFGEYVPFSNLFASLFDFMQVPMANMTEGKLIQGPLQLDNIKILPSICYEIAFPELIKTHDRDVSILLTITNDAWFGKSTAQAQHLQMAAMRALELARPLIFVSNDGITGVITPDGKISDSAPPHRIYVLTTKVQPMVGLTPWMENGTNPILFILLCLLFAAVRSKTAQSKLLNETLSAN